MGHLLGILISALFHITLFFLVFSAFINQPYVPQDEPIEEAPLRLSMFVPEPEPEPMIETPVETVSLEPESKAEFVPESKPAPIVKLVEKQAPEIKQIKEKSKTKQKIKIKKKLEINQVQRISKVKKEAKKKEKPKEQLRPVSRQANRRVVQEIKTQTPKPIYPRPAKLVSIAPAINAYKTAVREAIHGFKKYPRRARKAHQEGTVVIAFTILRSGQLENLRVNKSSGHDRLDQAALRAVLNIDQQLPIPTHLNKERWDFSVPLLFRLN